MGERRREWKEHGRRMDVQKLLKILRDLLKIGGRRWEEKEYGSLMNPRHLTKMQIIRLLISRRKIIRNVYGP